MSVWLIIVAISLWRLAGLGGNAIADLEQPGGTKIDWTSVWLPARFVSTRIDQQVAEEEVVECEILGTKIIGVSRCTGSLVSSIEGTQGRTEIRCVLKGVIESENKGTNGPATIDSTSSTTFTAIKIVRFDGFQLSTWPAELDTETSLKIINVDSHLKGLKGVVVKRIATSRAESTKEEVRAIAATLTKKRLAEKIDGEFEHQLSQVNLAIKLCRDWLFQIGNREIEILTRCREKNLEVGIALTSSDRRRR